MTAVRTFDAIRSSQQYRLHRRALVRRFFRTKPTVVERDALDTCATLAVRAERSASDASITPDELVKIVAAHRRSISTLELLSSHRKARFGGKSFGLLEARP
jgi:hypothetical protein